MHLGRDRATAASRWTARAPAESTTTQHFWVRQTGAPNGYYTNPTLRTGQSTAAETQATPYSFQVPLPTSPGLQGGQTYSSTTTGSNGFMLGTGATERKASGGIWQDSRVNPVLPVTCGLRVGLVLDFSGSTGPFNAQLKQAANTFVDSLVGTPSSMALFSFSYNSPAEGATQNFPTADSGIDGRPGHRIQGPLRELDLKWRHELGPRALPPQPRRRTSSTSS